MLPSARRLSLTLLVVGLLATVSTGCGPADVGGDDKGGASAGSTEVAATAEELASGVTEIASYCIQRGPHYGDTVNICMRMYKDCSQGPCKVRVHTAVGSSDPNVELSTSSNWGYTRNHETHAITPDVGLSGRGLVQWNTGLHGPFQCWDLIDLATEYEITWRDEARTVGENELIYDACHGVLVRRRNF